MDSHDIFRKLSQGAKFKRKLSAKKPCDSKKIKLDTDIKIKEEIKDDIFVDEHNDAELTLLGSIVANESGNKKKKIKKVFDDKKLLMLKQEEVNRFRNKNNINVVGRHVPEPFADFQQLPIANDLIENLTKCGYKEPTPIQKQAIPIMLNHRQILASAPTGSGKTAAFLVPLLHHLQEPQNKGFRAVVVCPTRELAKQTQRECVRLGEGRGFRIHVISKIKQCLTQYGPKSNQKFDILVTTPNRLCFLLNQDPPAIFLTNVEWLIIDEADKLFEDGLRGFRDQLDQIITTCKSDKLRIAMFSATQTAAVGQWCKRNMKGMINVTVGQRNAATELVDQELLFVGNEGGKLLAFRNLIRKGLAPPVLVFIQSKERAQQLFSELIYDGINVDAIHADRTQLQRDNTVKSFREGKIWVLICTELMARGVDFKGVNLVINYDFPPSAIAYIHRVGRAGRAGRKGKAITFFTTNDTPNMRSIAHVLRQSGCEVPEYMLGMKKQSKKERNTVIERDDITTKPKYVLEQNEKKRNRFVKPLPTKESRKSGKELETTDEKTKVVGRKTNNRNVAKKFGSSKHKFDKNKKFGKTKFVLNT